MSQDRKAGDESSKPKRKRFKPEEMTPWDIANHFGCGYTGDMNVFTYGGMFYSTQDWEDYGYASCVEVWDDYQHQRVIVSPGTIHKPGKPKMDVLMHESGFSDYTTLDQSHVIELQIEVVRDYYGIDPDCYQKDETFGEGQERAFWKHIIPLIKALGNKE